MAATSIGGGEWLVGPAAQMSSSSIFLIASVAIVLQVIIFNLVEIRYTLYTGEPIYGGIMRAVDQFWAGFLHVPGFFQLGVAWRAAASPPLFGAWMGRMPGSIRSRSRGSPPGSSSSSSPFCRFGGTIERMLASLAWTMLAVVFSSCWRSTSPSCRSRTGRDVHRLLQFLRPAKTRRLGPDRSACRHGRARAGSATSR